MDGGLISWLFSDLVLHGKMLLGDEKGISIKQLEIILEVSLQFISLEISTHLFLITK